MTTSSHAADLAAFRAAVRLAVTQYVALAATTDDAPGDEEEDEDYEPETAAERKHSRLAMLLRIGTTAALLGSLTRHYGGGDLSTRQYEHRVGDTLDTAVRHVLATARKEFAEPPAVSEDVIAHWSDGMAERLAAIALQVRNGEASAAQADNWTTYVVNTLWHAYQQERHAGAQARGLAHASFVLDPSVKDHCRTCLDRAAGNPYPIDELPGTPGDGETECGDADHCDLIYHREDDAPSGDEDEGDD